MKCAHYFCRLLFLPASQGLLQRRRSEVRVTSVKDPEHEIACLIDRYDTANGAEQAAHMLCRLVAGFVVTRSEPENAVTTLKWTG